MKLARLILPVLALLGYASTVPASPPDDAQSATDSHHVTPAGLPCGRPNLPRYERPDGMSFGRHMGTVWPQIQGFWAEAAARAGKPDVFGHEFFNLAAHAVRDKHFAEIYHPISRAAIAYLPAEKAAGSPFFFGPPAAEVLSVWARADNSSSCRSTPFFLFDGNRSRVGKGLLTAALSASYSTRCGLWALCVSCGPPAQG